MVTGVLSLSCGVLGLFFYHFSEEHIGGSGQNQQSNQQSFQDTTTLNSEFLSLGLVQEQLIRVNSVNSAYVCVLELILKQLRRTSTLLLTCKVTASVFMDRNQSSRGE